MGGPAGAREKDTAPSLAEWDIPDISANTRGGKANGCAGEAKGEKAAAACPLGGGEEQAVRSVSAQINGAKPAKFKWLMGDDDDD